MADQNTKTIEREYVIPLRRTIINVPQYRRAGKAVKAIKEFVAKHMKVEDRDTDKVKLDQYLNNEMWFRGRSKPPVKIKVKVKKEGDIVKVELAKLPEHVKFLKAKHNKKHKPSEKPVAQAKEEVKEQTQEQKKDEVEKEKATEVQHAKEAKEDAKAMKHTTKPEKAEHPRRMALQK